MVAYVLPTEIPVDRPFVTMKVVYVLNAALRKLWLTCAWLPDVEAQFAVSLKLLSPILHFGHRDVYHRARRAHMVP